MGELRPRGGLLGEHQRRGNVGVNRGVEPLDEVDRLEVLLAAVLVRLPLPRFLAVVEVEHRGQRADAQTVQMVGFQPEYRRRYQKADDLGTAEIEQAGVPLGHFAALGILALKERRAVKLSQREAVLGEVRRNPVHDDADAPLVQRVDQEHQVVGRAVARGRGKVARRLEAPARIIGMLGERHELHVREVHVAEVVGQLLSELTVGVEAAVLVALPRAGVDFVNIHRLPERIGGSAALLPLSVAPLIRAEVKDTRGVVGTVLRVKGKGVGLHHLLEPRGLDAVFVGFSLTDAFDEKLPVAVAVFMHKVFGFVPVIEAAHNGNTPRVGRPDTEEHTLLSVLLSPACAEVFIAESAVSRSKGFGGSADIAEAVVHKFNSHCINCEDCSKNRVIS